MQNRGIVMFRALAAPVVLLALLAPTAARAQTADDLFNDNVLQRIDLYVNTRDWAQLQAQYETNQDYPADLKWNGMTVHNAGIRSRGLGSRNAYKPGLRVDFGHYTSGQKFLGLSRLILGNLVQDSSNIKEPLTFKFIRRMGVVAPREAFARLYLNNTYFGLYVVIEDVNEDSLLRWFGENSGYLYKYQWLFDYWFTYLGSDLSAYLPLFEARTHALESVQSLYGPVETMIRTFNDAPDENFASAVADYVDVPQFMKLTAIQNFLAEWDGLLGYAGLNNFYFYRFNNKNVVQFIPWDEGNTFHLLDYPIEQGHAENVLMRRAKRIPEWWQVYLDTLEASAAMATETDGADPRGWFEREVVRMQDLTRAATLADKVKPFSLAEFEQGSADVLRFSQARAPFVRCEMRRLTDPKSANTVCTPPPAPAALRR
jgi:spore coat protein CotH